MDVPVHLHPRAPRDGQVGVGGGSPTRGGAGRPPPRVVPRSRHGGGSPAPPRAAVRAAGHRRWRGASRHAEGLPPPASSSVAPPLAWDGSPQPHPTLVWGKPGSLTGGGDASTDPSNARAKLPPPSPLPSPGPPPRRPARPLPSPAVYIYHCTWLRSIPPHSFIPSRRGAPSAPCPAPSAPRLPIIRQTTGAGKQRQGEDEEERLRQTRSGGFTPLVPPGRPRLDERTHSPRRQVEDRRMAREVRLGRRGRRGSRRRDHLEPAVQFADGHRCASAVRLNSHEFQSRRTRDEHFI